MVAGRISPSQMAGKGYYQNRNEQPQSQRAMHSQEALTEMVGPLVRSELAAQYRFCTIGISHAMLTPLLDQDIKEQSTGFSGAGP
jgi:hypothetical protein